MNRHSASGDPLLDEIDEARLRILAEHENDRTKVWQFYLEYQSSSPTGS